MRPPPKKVFRFAITTGDQDGVGPEVCYKALTALNYEPIAPVQIFVFRSESKSNSWYKPFLKRHPKVIQKNIDTASFTSKTLLAENYFPAPVGPEQNQLQIVEVLSSASPAFWVKWCAELCVKGELQGIVTGPLSKTEIQKAGLSSIGHTEILQKATGIKPAYMGFLGSKFNVVLGSGHIPARMTGRQFLASFNSAYRAAEQLRSLLPLPQRALPIAVLGINPHASEGGLIGSEDLTLQKKISALRKKGHSVIGPLVPDVAFRPINWKNYSVFLASGHDQGLIPFKMVHGFDEGVHLTLGLPILRTSVDHGTAKDLFGKNRALAGSMKSAIEFCLRAACERKRKDKYV